jgi:hypothetical protein
MTSLMDFHFGATMYVAKRIIAVLGIPNGIF